MEELLPALVLVALALISHTPVAWASQPNATHDFLEAHNDARAKVGVESLKWSDMLAKATSLVVQNQKEKMDCNFADLSEEKYGGNQLRVRWWGATPRYAVDTWVAQKKYYKYASNSCAARHSKCWAYTQVVWRKAVELGCSQASCIGSALTICFYNPPPNFGKERPY